MSTAVAGSNAPAALFSGSTDFAGTPSMLRLMLRRDRVVLPLWVTLVGVMPAIQLVSVRGLYSTQQQLDSFATSTANSPALLAMYGPVFGSQLGSIGTWKAGAMYTVLAIATILTVIRHTRVEEETGRAELIGATSVGRYAGLTATLLMTYGGAVLVGLVCALTLRASDLPMAGSIAYGAGLTGSGVVFASVAAVAAQLSAGARVARGMAFGVLGAMFALRAVGDAGNGVLSWFSPLGWCLQVRPFAEERWWALLPLAATAVVGTVATYGLLRRRDTGAGLFAERPGPAAAAGGLAGPLGLAWRLHRGTFALWSIGFVLYGLLIGSAVGSVSDLLGGSATIEDAVIRAGGSTQLSHSFITYMLTMLAAAAAAYSVSATLRLHEEEVSGRTEAVFSGAVSRIRYLLAHLVFALLGPALALVLAGATIGAMYGRTTGEPGAEFLRALGAALVQVPAVWVITGIAVAIYGLRPRWTPVSWGVLSAAVLIFFLGSLDGLPQWIVDLAPFVHPPKLPGGRFELPPLLWLLGVTASLLIVGVLAFRRRDLR